MTYAHKQGETLLTRRLIERIRDTYRGHAIKVHGSQYQSSGEPDISGCLHGRALKIEVKVPGKQPTPRQYAAMRRWQAAGALAGWVTSIEELDALLTHVGDPGWSNPQLAPGVGVARIEVDAASVRSA